MVGSGGRRGRHQIRRAVLDHDYLGNRYHARLGTADDSFLPVVVPSRLVFYLEERSAFSVEHSYMICIKYNCRSTQESGPSPLILLSVMGNWELW